MTGAKVEVREEIVPFKRKVAPNREALKRACADVRNPVRRAADNIINSVAAGRGVVPEIDYRDIRNSKVSELVRQLVRDTGCAVVRGTVERWDLGRAQMGF